MNQQLHPVSAAEVNEIATLTAQANYLQSQGDPVSAAVVASYVPDHRMMASLLAAQITVLGDNPSIVIALELLYLGTRTLIIRHDITAHQKGIDVYRRLARDNDPTLAKLGLLGFNGASRHFFSLRVARASVDNTRYNLRTGVESALLLECMALAICRRSLHG